ncbi:unnamed protein product, partial [Heterotrigona itama]
QERQRNTFTARRCGSKKAATRQRERKRQWLKTKRQPVAKPRDE